MRILVWLVTFTLTCVIGAPASAQTSSNSSRTFVDVPLGPDWDDARTDRISSATWRSGLALGFDWGRSGVEIDVGVPEWHAATLGPQRYQYAGQSYGWEQQFHFYEWSGTTRRRSIDVMALYRRNVPVNRHVMVGWLVGSGIVLRPVQNTSVTREVMPDDQLIEVDTHQTTSSRDYAAGAGRLDVELKVAPHVSIVPRVRATVFPSMLDDSGLAPRVFWVRPEVGVRWRF
jgi:hypothetical protein